MMTAREIAAILIAFDEGKLVVRTSDKMKVTNLTGLLQSIAHGLHFEVAREPVVRWLPTFSGVVTSGYESKESAAYMFRDNKEYTGAVQFKEVSSNE